MLSVPNNNHKRRHDKMNFFEPWESLPASHDIFFKCCDSWCTPLLSICAEACSHWSIAAYSSISSRLLTLTRRTRHFSRDARPARRFQEPIKGMKCSFVFLLTPRSSWRSVSNRSRTSARWRDPLRRRAAVIVLESKVGAPANDWQATNINLHGQPIQFARPTKTMACADVLCGVHRHCL